MCYDIFGVCKYTCFGIKSERLGSSQLENVHVSIDNPHNYIHLLIYIYIIPLKESCSKIKEDNYGRKMINWFENVVLIEI